MPDQATYSSGLVLYQVYHRAKETGKPTLQGFCELLNLLEVIRKLARNSVRLGRMTSAKYRLQAQEDSIPSSCLSTQADIRRTEL